MRERNPLMLDAYLQMLGVRSDPQDVIAQRDCIYWLTFDKTDVPTPPPLEADLRWVLPAVGAAAILTWQVVSGLRRRED
jgi:hypothetical protein